MREIPIIPLFLAIGGVAIMGLALGRIYQQIASIASGGPFSGILSGVGVATASGLALLGGGLLLAVGWHFGLLPDNSF